MIPMWNQIEVSIVLKIGAIAKYKYARGVSFWHLLSDSIRALDICMPECLAI
jgi:hypothetical protein